MNERKYELLLAAVEIYSRRGDRFTLSDLGRNGGYTDASGVVYHFGSKGSLMREIVEFAITQPDDYDSQRVILRATLDPQLCDLVPAHVLRYVLTSSIEGTFKKAS